MTMPRAAAFSDPPALPRGRWRVLDSAERLSMVSYAGGFFAVSLIALWLRPDGRGVGTHEQLGLPPCTTQALLHIPCPFCGMTTAFSYMVHGHLLEAFLCQPAGALLYAIGAVCAVAAVGMAITGRSPWFAVDLLRRRWVWALSFATLLAAWIYKIATFV